MIIVADAGGTKTDWWFGSDDGGCSGFASTGGLNASTMREAELKATLREATGKIMESAGVKAVESSRVCFFGAGCNSDVTVRIIRDAIESVFPSNWKLSRVSSDLEGAAIALFGDSPGVACIMGTGSASGLYEGRRIKDSVPSLGYILGDEGSGAFMGKLLLNSYFKRELSTNIESRLREYADVTLPNVIQNLYKVEKPAAYLASFVPFLKKNQEEPEISRLIDYSLKLFFSKNVLKYNDITNLDIGFIGGVACSFENRIRSVANEFGLHTSKFIKQPIAGLAAYYTKTHETK